MSAAFPVRPARAAALLLVPLLLALAGCGGNPAVSGKVTLGGSPLEGGSVTFHPDTARGNNAGELFVGQIGPQGTYKLVGRDKEGAPPGWYRVTVNYSVAPDPKDATAKPRALIHKKYIDPNTTPLSIEVKSGAAPGAYDLTVSK
jgi:hypothetical protein